MLSSRKAVSKAFAILSLVFSLLISAISYAPTAEANAIPAAARLIGAGGNVYSQNQGNSNTPSSCLGGTRGITSDGSYVYYRASNSSSVICKTTLAGVFVSANTVTNLSSYSSEQRALTYANGCILFRNTYVAGSGIMCVDTSTWVLYGPFTPTGTAIPEGGGWLLSNIMNFPDGRIGAVSKPTATLGVGGGSGANACPSNMYCKILRLYTVTRTSNSLSINWSEDVTLADPDSGWPSDDHGMATDGTYLYQIKHESGYKVWKLNSGTPSTIIFNGDGGGTPCGATSGTSNTFCPIYSPINGSSRLMSNATFFGRSHLTNQYIMGDYDSSVAQFWISASVAPPAGIGSDVTAPVLSAQSASSLAQTTASLNFTSGEAGTYYYLIYASASSAPDTSTIISQGASPPTVVKGTSSATASANTVAVTGLTNGTSYKAYVVVKDSSGNTSLISTISFTTVVSAPAFTLSASSATRTYLTSGTAFTTNSTGGLIASFSISATPAGMSFDTSTGTLSGAPTTIAAATTYTVTATNVTGTATQNFVLTVSARPITIKAANKTATYSGSAALVTNSYTITSGTMAGSDTFTSFTYTYSSGSYSASQTAPTNAGTYTITPSAAVFSVGSASNYTITYDTATLTIGVAAQAGLTVSSTSGTYGTTLRLTASGGSGTGAITYSTGTAGCSITNTDSLTVISALTCSVTATRAADSNYTAISSSATNVIFAARPITIKAVNKSATYTGSAVSVTNSYTITSGTMAGSDTFTALTYTYSSAGYSASQTAPTIAGSYTITPSAASFSVGSASNYIITYDTATLTINKANQGALTITTTTSKYGTPLRLVTSGGSGTGALSFAITSAGSASGCSISIETITVNSFGTCKVTATKALDTNYLVIDSAETTITFSKADTLTVTSDTPTALTFTGSEAVFNPSVTVVSGLVTGDVISGATYNYSASAASCAAGGICSIGQTGPGGGLVFITPTTTGNTTGKYFEAAPVGWSGTAADPLAKLCTNATTVTGASGTAIGTGESNTNLFAASSACGVSAADTATALVLGGKDDWFLPSFDELKEMYSKLHKAVGGALGGFNTSGTVDYLSSSDNPSGVAPAGAPYALYGWFGSSDGVAGWGSTSKTASLAYRPVRSFVATSTSTVNYGPTTTKPTNAATYTITPSALTFSSGATTNYAAVTYQTSTLTINKAAQATLITTPLYNVFNGNPTSAMLYTTGGSDTGTVTYAYVSSLSTAGGCALSGADSSTVTVTSAGTCRIVATKAATNNYLVAISDTGTVTFYVYVSYIPAPRAAEYPAEIVLSGATAMTSNGLAPTITTTGVDITKSPGATFTISGSGFVGTRLVRVSGTNAAFTVLSDTSLQITMPSGLVGISGPIYVEKAEGSRSSEDWVTGTA